MHSGSIAAQAHRFWDLQLQVRLVQALREVRPGVCLARCQPVPHQLQHRQERLGRPGRRGCALGGGPRQAPGLALR